MTTMRIAEVFGYAIEDESEKAKTARKDEYCPYRKTACTKSSKIHPLGICSFTDGQFATAVCPYRFLEKDRIFLDAARIAFGEGKKFVPVPEISILQIEGKRKVGKVDYLLTQVDDNLDPIDFAALEVQSVYISGKSIRPAFEHFLEHGSLPDDPKKSRSRPDYRSSAQKRLMPQLRLKVPVFRRWGKRFFVVIDALFFQALPEFPTVDSGNTEITWLSYPLAFTNNNKSLLSG